MQAAVAMKPEMPAVEARERLVAFVAEMAAGLPHVRQARTRSCTCAD
jgi:hypothetical protein